MTGQFFKAVIVSVTMIADEQTSDFFKLFMAVQDKGGYDAVSRNDLWDLVARESGLVSIISSTVRVLYIKYLNILERLVEKIAENKDYLHSFCRNDSDTGFSENMIKLKAEFNSFLSDVRNLKTNDELHGHTNLTRKLNFCDRDDENVDVKINREKSDTSYREFLCNSRKRKVDVHDTSELYEGQDPSLKFPSNVELNSHDIEEPCILNFREERGLTKDEVESRGEFSNGCRKCDDYDSDNKDGTNLDSTSAEEHNISHEREHAFILAMINWLTRTAKDPCGPVTGLLPERSKWKSFGNEEIWKQVLLFREAMLLKRHINSSALRYDWQKIHPCMFDDHQGSSYKLRERLKLRKILPSGKSMSQALSEMSSGPNHMVGMEDQLNHEMLGTTDSWMPGYMGKYASKHIPLGPAFQVEVPDWNGTVSESHSKWLGTLVWPSNRVNWVSPIELDLIGKGRQDLCACHLPGSTECIHLHISEKKYKVKMELGSAFDQWKFDRMGEEVTLCWTKKEERKFNDAVRSCSAYLTKSFWTEIFKVFSSKSREDLVCYYFNVFLLRRRRIQNRFTPDNICSDDDELEFESAVTPN